MESENHVFLQAVKVPHAELWYSRNEDLVLSHEGDVQIIYSQPLNKFILRLQDFKVVLDKSVHIIGSIVGRNRRQAYLLPRGVGFTMIRLPDAKTFPALENFETLLENTSSFSRQPNVDPTLATFKELKENGGLASSLINSMSRAFSHPADDSHPNQKIKRTFEQLLDLDSHGVSVVDINDAELASLSKKNELDGTGSEQSDLWKALMGQGTYSGYSQPNETKQERTSDISQPQGQSFEMKEMKSNNPSVHKYTASHDNQEVTGAQEQRLPSYEVQNSTEFLRKNLRKASANVQAGDSGSDKEQENVQLPDPVHYEDEAFTTGLLTKDDTQVANTGNDNKDYPVENEDAFVDLTHPMRKFSLVDRPFLEEDEHVEAEKPKAEPHKGFHGQPIITAKGQPTLKSNIDDQPSPIPNTEKYSEPTQPEKSTFGRSNQNIIRESSQGNETKQQRKAAEQPIDKENLTAPTTV